MSAGRRVRLETWRLCTVSGICSWMYVSTSDYPRVTRGLTGVESRGFDYHRGIRIQGDRIYTEKCIVRVFCQGRRADVGGLE